MLPRKSKLIRSEEILLLKLVILEAAASPNLVHLLLSFLMLDLYFASKYICLFLVDLLDY